MKGMTDIKIAQMLDLPLKTVQEKLKSLEAKGLVKREPIKTPPDKS